jgi:hypothetical protein
MQRGKLRKAFEAYYLDLLSNNIPEVGRVTFGTNTYSSLSELLTKKYGDTHPKIPHLKEPSTAWEHAMIASNHDYDRRFKPELFSLNPTFSRADYLELFPPLTITKSNRRCILVAGQSMISHANIRDKFIERFAAVHINDYSVEEDKLLRQFELYPQEGDNIKERDFFVNVADFYGRFGSIAVLGYDGMYVVDRLDSDEMLTYSKFRASNKPDVIGIFDNSKLAAFVFSNRSF